MDSNNVEESTDCEQTERHDRTPHTEDMNINIAIETGPTPNTRPRKRRSNDDDDLPPHNTDCDCSTSDGDYDSNTFENEAKRLRTDDDAHPAPTEVTRIDPPREQDEGLRRSIEDFCREQAVNAFEAYTRGDPVPASRLLQLRLNDGDPPIPADVAVADVLARMSDRHLDEVYVSDSSSSFILSEDMNFTRLPTRPRLWNDNPQFYEFEVGSVSPSLENPNPIEDMTTSTDDEAAGAVLVQTSSSSDWSAKGEAERGNFADSSDSESDAISKKSGLSTDSELSDQDKWFCTQCNAKTNVPYFRYCLRCFNLRRNWLPPRPKLRGKARPPIKAHRQRLRALYTYPPVEEEPGSIPCSTPDEERASTHSSNLVRSNSTESSSSPVSNSGATENVPGPSRDLSVKLQSALDAPPVSVSAATDARDEPLCIICMGREKNAGFVHGKTAHFCCCYQCGDKILKKAGKCPVCRKRILRVVKIIS